MKQIYRVDKSGNFAQAISEITAPKLLLLMSNNEQFEQHVEELERHFPGVPKHWLYWRKLRRTDSCSG